MPRRATLLPAVPALLALGLPVTAGAMHMLAADAPAHYPALNLGALAAAGLLIVLRPVPATLRAERVLAAVLLAILLLPLFVGPATGGVARWIALGPVTLNTGLLAVPALAVIAARDEPLGAVVLLAALALLSLQPDAAAGFALTFAAVGVHHATQDWRIGLVAVIGFFASLAMAMRGELPPQPFVERVLVDAAHFSPVIALALAAALIAGFVLIARWVALERAARLGVAGALFGFGALALMSHYPTPLIGYGASAIVGFALALSLNRKAAA